MQLLIKIAYKMAGEASVSNSGKKKSKLVRQESGKGSEIETEKCTAGSSAQTTRGGLRVYKIVVLGDGGVGKSGTCYNYIFLYVNIIVLFWFQRLRYNS